MAADLLLSQSAAFSAAVSDQLGRAQAPEPLSEAAPEPLSEAAPEPAVPATPCSLSLEAIYAENFRFVWRCLRSLGVREAVLDDAVQEVFLVVRRRLPEFSGEVRPWLFAIVRRIALRARKRASVEESRFVQAATCGEIDAQPTRDLRSEMDARYRLDVALRALEQLDDAKREVFVFCLIEGFSAPEVAGITGVPLNTVYSRLRAARGAFSDAIAHLQQGGRVASPSGRKR